MHRRTFLLGTGAVVGGGLVGGPFQGFVAGVTSAHPRASSYGTLAPVRDKRDGLVRLELPEGFNYRSFHPAGSMLRDGTTTIPGRHDGMAAFPGRRRNTAILVRNHEINGPGTPFGDASDAYDPLTRGGTISVEVDRHGRRSDHRRRPVPVRPQRRSRPGGPGVRRLDVQPGPPDVVREHPVGHRLQHRHLGAMGPGAVRLTVPRRTFRAQRVPG